MRALPILLAACTAVAAAPAQAATPGVFWDCASIQPQPVFVDLNCQHADAHLTSLTWSGRRARGSFNYLNYSVSDGTGLMTLPARVTVSRARTLAGTTAYTRLTVTLFGKRRDRDGLSRRLRYVLTCDLGQGWVPARVARPC